jgi:UDP-hydrolysing UDP-N-acetyl-D-glucosamine 2-epimerase
MNLSKFKVFIITSSRSDYGILENLIEKIQINKRLDTFVIVTGSHFNKKLGYSYSKINIKNKKKILRIKISNHNDKIDSSIQTISEIFLKYKNYIKKYKPTMQIILGDRYEILPFAVTGHIYKIKTAHIHGGELTYGSIDDSIRHAITKFSNLHFVSNSVYKKRVTQLGENKKNVYHVGSLSLEKLNKKKLLNKYSLQNKLKIKLLERNLLVVIHPLTLTENNIKDYNALFIDTVIKALSKLKNTKLIFSKPNADFGYSTILNKIKDFSKKNKNSVILDNLGGFLFFSLLNNVDMIIGNSSAGIIEAPSFNIPTINIGDRQNGRVNSDSVLNCDLNHKDILKKIEIAYSTNFKNKLLKVKNPYFKKNTSNRIIQVITKRIKEEYKYKKFYDL